jgi:Zn finger protein HypA/HybF involved in hydrogenase expression
MKTVVRFDGKHVTLYAPGRRCRDCNCFLRRENEGPRCSSCTGIHIRTQVAQASWVDKIEMYERRKRSKLAGQQPG